MNTGGPSVVGVGPSRRTVVTEGPNEVPSMTVGARTGGRVFMN